MFRDVCISVLQSQARSYGFHLHGNLQMSCVRWKATQSDGRCADRRDLPANQMDQMLDAICFHLRYLLSCQGHLASHAWTKCTTIDLDVVKGTVQLPTLL